MKSVECSNAHARSQCGRFSSTRWKHLQSTSICPIFNRELMQEINIGNITALEYVVKTTLSRKCVKSSLFVVICVNCITVCAPLNLLHNILLGYSCEYLTSFVVDFASSHQSEAAPISSSNVCVANSDDTEIHYVITGWKMTKLRVGQMLLNQPKMKQHIVTTNHLQIKIHISQKIVHKQFANQVMVMIKKCLKRLGALIYEKYAIFILQTY